MNSPSSESSPTGALSDRGWRDASKIRRSFEVVTPVWAPTSSGVGSRPISCSIWREVRTILLIVSIMCTGMRMVRAWSAIERVIACLIHHVA